MATATTSTGATPPNGIIHENRDEHNITSTTTTMNVTTTPLVLQDLRHYVRDDRSHHHHRTNKNEDMMNEYNTTIALPVAAMKALLNVVQRSKAETMMGLQDELKNAAYEIIHHSTDVIFSTTTTTSATEQHDGNEINTTNDDLDYDSDYFMISHYTSSLSSYHTMSLQSGCELFLKYITRTFLEIPNFDICKQNILYRGENYISNITQLSRSTISSYAYPFIRSNHGQHPCRILTHGLSRVVATILYDAKHKYHKYYDLTILEGRPDCSGIKAAQFYSSILNHRPDSSSTNATTSSHEIPITVIVDSAMGYIMEQIDIVLIGAEGVMENGGIINKIGTLSLAMIATMYKKPVYVAVESYKFTRLYPLSQSDIPTSHVIPSSSSSTTVNQNNRASEAAVPFEFVDTTKIPIVVSKEGQEKTAATSSSSHYLPIISYDKEHVKIQNPTVDYTPSKYITLLFTDLGVLTPSAVSDELIRLYQ